jgi:hypothetical protein
MLPEELAGMKRSNFNVHSQMGYSVGDATYRNEGSDARLHLSIIDCAGEAGAGVYSLNYWTRMSMVTENDNGYSKTVDFNVNTFIQ